MHRMVLASQLRYTPQAASGKPARIGSLKNLFPHFQAAAK